MLRALLSSSAGVHMMIVTLDVRTDQTKTLSAATPHCDLSTIRSVASANMWPLALRTNTRMEYHGVPPYSTGADTQPSAFVVPHRAESAVSAETIDLGIEHPSKPKAECANNSTGRVARPCHQNRADAVHDAALRESHREATSISWHVSLTRHSAAHPREFS